MRVARKGTRAAVACLLLLAMMVVIPTTAGAQDPDPADLVVEIYSADGLPDVEELVFATEGNCVADEIRIPVSELVEDRARSLLYERISRTPECWVELTNLPDDWRIVAPLTNPAELGDYRTVIEGAADEMVWRLEAIPATHTATLAVKMVLQFDRENAPQGGAPDVAWACTDGTDVSADLLLFNNGETIGENNEGLVVRHEMLVAEGSTCTGSFDQTEGWAGPGSSGPITIGADETAVLKLVIRQLEAAPFMCGKTEATIVGSIWDDDIVATSGRDIIYVDAGDDLVAGKGGNDVICGGPGNDVLLGNGGKDKVKGGSGADLLKGGKGVDRLIGGPGNDKANGGADEATCKAERQRRCGG